MWLVIEIFIRLIVLRDMAFEGNVLRLLGPSGQALLSALASVTRQVDVQVLGNVPGPPPSSGKSLRQVLAQLLAEGDQILHNASTLGYCTLRLAGRKIEGVGWEAHGNNAPPMYSIPDLVRWSLVSNLARSYCPSWASQTSRQH